MKRKWVTIHKFSTELGMDGKYWYCPNKCGNPHYPDDPCSFTCAVCGYTYNVIAIQNGKVLIEVNNESKS